MTFYEGEVDEQCAFECDTCNKVARGADDEDFHELWDRLRADGWSAFLVHGVWKHNCRGCD